MKAEPSEAVDTQLLHGMVISSDFPLHQGRPAWTQPVDVTVATGSSIGSNKESPDGEVLLDFRQAEDHWYTLTRRTDGSYLFRVYTLCDFEISADRSRVVIRLVDGVESGMTSVLTVGTLCALMLYLRGLLVLHASAVEFDGAAVAVMGHSGMGKTTLAGLLCTAGGRIVSDDVVPVQVAPEPVVLAGSTELRLRPGTRLLQDRFVREDHRTSADGREVLRLAPPPRADVPLAGIVIPLPNRIDRLELERLPGPDSLIALSAFPRLMGWRDPGVVRGLFAQAATLAKQVPVYRAHVPWGPPFRDDIAPTIRDAVLSAGVGSAAHIE